MKIIKKNIQMILKVEVKIKIGSSKSHSVFVLNVYVYSHLLVLYTQTFPPLLCKV